ncbi:MAG: hypothetical protein ABSH42_18410 [Bryobacteraceae bacterium]
MGLFLAVSDGQKLLAARFPHSPWNRALLPLDLLFLIWMLFAFWLWLSTRDFGASSHLSGEDALTFALAVCAGLAVWLAKAPWATGIMGVCFSIAFLGVGLARRRRYYVAATGWCIAGFAVPRFFTWPDLDMQLSALFFLGGIATALQGAWELVRSLRLQRSQPEPDSR